MTRTLRSRIATLEAVVAVAVGPSDAEYQAASAREGVGVQLMLDRLACKTAGREWTPPPLPDVLAGDMPEQEA